MENSKGKKTFILALDQGTTSSRTVLFDSKFSPVCEEKIEFRQIYPKAGWVEHNPWEILKSQFDTVELLFKRKNIGAESVAGIGITNQRETTLVWNAKTGKPVCNAIVWQCRRTSEFCRKLKKDSKFASHVRWATGLPIDAYFSATKLKWILDNVRGARSAAQKGELLFGTVDSWLVWNLTKGRVHATDFTNASRTMLFNIRKLDWDDEILDRLGIPRLMLPKVFESSGNFGDASLPCFGGRKIPILAVAGDQQSSLFGQECFERGDVKNTYGTGCFMLMNTGKKFVDSKHGLITTLTAQTKSGNPSYALEGSVFMAGAIMQWLRDELKILKSSSEAGKIAKKAGTSNGVVLVPAFAGLGAPYWDMFARAAIFGMTRGTNSSHIIRAAEEAIAFQVRDLFSAMKADFRLSKPEGALRVDGGACADDFLMQFQSDIINMKISRPKCLETTAKGAAMLAAKSLGIKKFPSRAVDRIFSSKMSDKDRKELVSRWSHAVQRTLGRF